MAIDTSIYGQLRPVQIENPLDQYARVAQVQSMQQRNRLTDLMFAEKEREAQYTGQRRNALMSAMNQETGAIDAAAYRKGLAGIGDYEGLQTFEASQAAQAKAQREAEKERIAAAKAQVELIGQVAGSARDPQSYAHARAVLAQSGIDVSNVPEQYDPAYVANARDQARTEAQKLEHFWKAKGYDLDVEKFGYQQKNDAANRNVTIRGQNLSQSTAIRGQDLSAATARRGQDLTNARALETNAAGKAPTEFQGKSAGFGARAEAADKIIAELTGKYSPAAVNAKTTVGSWPVVGGILGDATNKLALSEADQRAEQAQRDFVNAVLRQESGAAIGAAEFDNAAKQYFPQPGDTKAVIEQKSRNRQLAIQGFKQNAGKAAFSAPPQANPADVLNAADKILGL